MVGNSSLPPCLYVRPFASVKNISIGYNSYRRLIMLVKLETYFDGEFWCALGIGGQK